MHSVAMTRGKPPKRGKNNTRVPQAWACSQKRRQLLLNLFAKPRGSRSLVPVLSKMFRVFVRRFGSQKAAPPKATPKMHWVDQLLEDHPKKVVLPVALVLTLSVSGERAEQ
jgi:hypothetical protein